MPGWRMGGHGRDHPIVFVGGAESSNPQRISKKIGGTDIEAKALFLLLVEGILTRLSSLVV